MKQAERQDVSSTSKAAELVAQDTTGSSAAISSKIAAELNGLDVLAEGIEDSEGNSTRFFILRRRQDVLALCDETKINESMEMEQYKTLVSFTVNHGEPGALANSLEVFKEFVRISSVRTILHDKESGAPIVGVVARLEHVIYFEMFANHVPRLLQDLNLTSINTRPSGEAQWHYIFFVEFLGRKRPDGKGGAVNEALSKLTEVASGWRWLGSWESALKE